MSKFISLKDGSYANLNSIWSIEVGQFGKNFDVRCYFNETTSQTYKIICSGFPSSDEAQLYLDNMIMKYGLALGVVKEN